MNHATNKAGDGALCGAREGAGEVLQLARTDKDVTCSPCLNRRFRPGGRKRKVNPWMAPEVRDLLARADKELASASACIREARSLSELADAEIEADKACHRIKSAMAKERELRGLNR